MKAIYQLFFQSPESQFKNSCQFWLTTSLSLEDGLRLLVSSNLLLIFNTLTCRRQQITVIEVLGPEQFWLVVSWDLANLNMPL
jgi:hypothetical protein